MFIDLAWEGGQHDSVVHMWTFDQLTLWGCAYMLHLPPFACVQMSITTMEEI